jgi:3-dehydroquinate synthase
VGGKNAVDLPEGKNLAGAIHQPEAVFADTSVLSTLPAREWYSGMAEVVKTALTLDPVLLALLEREGIAPGGPDAARVVAACCRRKAEVVAADEREQGWRRVLNFGHTLAHALEAAGGYGGLTHGEAVVEGMKAALALSRSAARLPASDLERARRLIALFPPREWGGGGERLLPFLRRDKKAAAGKVTAVLLEAIGRPAFVPLDDPGALLRARAEWEGIAGD